MAMPASMDRLSGLPDEMIGHILSFLPTTKSFVQTSVLAKQWRFLWTRIPALGFTVDNSKSIIEEDEFSSWIKDTSTIFARNNMVIRLNYKLALPRFLFTSNNLVDLCIIDSGDISVEDTVYNFPALKKLQLVNVGYDSGDSLTHLISGCPVLEELIVQGTKLNYSDSSALIKPDTFDKPTTIRYLRLRGGRLSTITHQARDSVLNIVRSLLPPTSAICRKEAHMVNHLILEPSTFRNLTQLDLGSDHWYFITSFLSFAKNLRVLTIHRTVGHKLGWTEHTNYEWVLMNHLETINLYGFEWSTKHEFEMVKFMLRKAKVLKTMDLIYTAPRYQESDWKNKVVALVRLASFKMKSLTCSIRLIGNNMRVVVTRNKRRARRNPRGVK